MFLILAEVLRFCEIAKALPESGFWKFLCHHQSHAQWVGCSLHDLIQPSFSFVVGAVMPFSIANREARGQTFGPMVRHATLRCLILIVLGIALLSSHSRQLTWDFDDTLTQIGLAYPFVFLLAFRPVRDRWIAFGSVLVLWWVAFALYPLPGPGFDYAAVGVSPEWLNEHGLSGFAAHWQKNSNLAAAFDRWFLNLFPQNKPHVGFFNGLTTLNFIPLTATLLLGLIGGDLLRSDRSPWAKVRWLSLAAVVGWIAGRGLGAAGICPVAKPIWTPSWVLFSGGWCFAFLAFFYLFVDILGQKKLTTPLLIIGANSILAYAMSHLYPAFAFNSWKRIFGSEVFRVFGPAYEPLVYGAVVLLTYWLILFVFYRKKIFLRI